MVWKLLLGFGGMVLNLLALPTILDPQAQVPRYQSTLIAASLLVFFTVPYIAMQMWLPAAATFIGFILWGIVAKYRAID